MTTGVVSVEDIPADELDGYAAAFAPARVTAISMKQCQLELLASGLLGQVEALISSMPAVVQVTWRTSTVVQRDNTLVLGLMDALGISPEQADEMFLRASLNPQ